MPLVGGGGRGMGIRVEGKGLLIAECDSIRTCIELQDTKQNKGRLACSGVHAVALLYLLILLPTTGPLE